MAIAVLGFLVWGHHMFVSGQSVYAGMVFSILSFLVAIPSGDQSVQLDGDALQGLDLLQAPMLYALGFIGLFTIGGLTGLFLASLAMDVHRYRHLFRRRAFSLHHGGRHGDGVSWAALHYWWPKITGRLYPEGWAQFAALIIFVGFNLTFFPQFVLGYLGMPRRYHEYPPEFQVLNVMSTAGASILAVGYVMPLIYLFWSLRYGKMAGPNPWGATGLEWQTPSPPPTENFEETPVVTEEAYAYAESESSHG